MIHLLSLRSMVHTASCALLAVLLLVPAVRAEEAVLLQENFDAAATVKETVFSDLSHADQETGAEVRDESIVLASPGRGGAGKALHWTRAKSGGYRVQSPSCMSPTGAFTVRFWVHLTNEAIYHWEFHIRAGNAKPLLVLQKSQKMNNPGNLGWITADGGCVTLSAARKGWTQVRLDVDLRAKTCTVFYGDMDVPVAVGLQLLSQRVQPGTPFCAVFTGLSSRGEPPVEVDDFSVQTWTPPSVDRTPGENANLSNKVAEHLVAATVSLATGALTGLSRDGIPLVTSSNDIYTLQSEKNGAWAWEADDSVASASGDDGKRTFHCTNPKLPGIKITKTYAFDPDGSLLKRVEFASELPEGFLTYHARIAMDEAFVAGSYPRGFSPGLGRIDPGPSQSLDAAPFRIMPDRSLGLSVSRNRVNDRPVLNNHPSAAEMVSRTAEGWNLRVFSAYLSPAQAVSGEVVFRMFSGDFVAFAQQMAKRAIHRELFDDKRPDWTRALACDAMYAAVPGATDMAKALAPLPVTSTIWFLAPPWGNWWGASDPPSSSHHSVQAISGEIRTASPNARISAYTNTLFSQESDIDKKHRSFGVIDKSGDLIGGGWPTDALMTPTYLFQIMNPEARSYWLAMHADRMAWQPPGWSLDFFYMDGPGWGHEVPDWKLKTVAQAYDWTDFASELKRALKGANPDAAFFTNGMVPHSDIGYIEGWDSWWETLNGKPGNWPELARMFLLTKLAEGDKYTIVLLFDRGVSQPSISTYAITYGWCGMSQTVAHIPWLLAALEYRGIQVVSDGVVQPWWREKSTPETEACAFRKGTNVVVQAIRHASGKADVTLQLDSAKLGLEPGKTYLLRELQMKNPVADPVPDKAFSQTRIERLTIPTEPLDLTLGTTQALLTSALISEAWCVVERIGNHPCETGIPENYGITVELKNRDKGLDTYSIKVDETYAATGATLFFPWATSVTIDPPTAPTSPATLEGVQGVRVEIPAAGTFTATVAMDDKS